MGDNEFLSGFLAGQGDGGGGNKGGGFFGGDGSWIFAIIILAMVFGGGNMFGNGGGRFEGWATQADVRAAVDQQTLISKLDQQTYGLADTFTALNNTLNNNFRGIDNAMCTLGYNTQQGFNNLSHQMSDCCCETRAAIKDVGIGVERAGWNLSKQISDCCCDIEKMNMQNRFDAAQMNCGTLQAIDKLGDRIIGYMADRDTQNMRDELQSYRLAASQMKQNQYLIDQLRPCPVPAYLTCNPYAASYGFNTGGNGGCGCC